MTRTGKAGGTRNNPFELTRPPAYVNRCGQPRPTKILRCVAGDG